MEHLNLLYIVYLKKSLYTFLVLLMILYEKYAQIKCKQFYLFREFLLDNGLVGDSD